MCGVGKVSGEYLVTIRLPLRAVNADKELRFGIECASHFRRISRNGLEAWAKQFRQALRAPQPTEALRAVVRCLLAQGYEREAVAAELESCRRVLQRDGREADEDVVLEVMDFLAGWCSPYMPL
jgi:hypothetical protein